MYFIVIMAFAFVLAEDLPPARLSLVGRLPHSLSALPPGAVAETLLIVACSILLTLIAAHLVRRRTLAQLDGRPDEQDRAVGTFSNGQRILMGMIAAGLVVTMLMTPWTRLVRDDWGLGRLPLLAEAVSLTPFIGTLVLIWTILYPAELALRLAAKRCPSPVDELFPDQPLAEPLPAVVAPTRVMPHPTHSLGAFLFDKLRHQFLIVAAPMTLIVFARYFTSRYRERLDRALVVPWGADAILGCVSGLVLIISPAMLRYIWATEPLPAGPLRDRLERLCRRVNLHYREILLWNTHGMTVNAAVMGFFAPLRYVLISDALLETMKDDEIETVFAHEAGHVRHWHLHYFVLFVIAAMFLTQGVIEVLARTGLATRMGLVTETGGQTDTAMLQVISLVVLLLLWLFGFGWVSRQFERQADLFGVRCMTTEIGGCVPWCPVHGTAPAAPPSSTTSRFAGASGTPVAVAAFVSPGMEGSLLRPSSPRQRLCVSAASLFGRTLFRIGDLNGIPRSAPSWRHGTIESRCRLIEQLATQPRTLTRFDRRLFLTKLSLVVIVLGGTAIGAWLYWHDLAALGRHLLPQPRYHLWRY